MKRTASRDFWKAYDFVVNKGGVGKIFENDADRARYQCIAGCAALELTLREWWKDAIVPEWAEIQTLLLAMLRVPEELNRVAESVDGVWPTEELKLKLETLSRLDSPVGFQPSISDIAAMTCLFQPTKTLDGNYRSWIAALVEIEQIRDRHLIGNEKFNEVIGQKSLQLIHKIRSQGQRFNPLFLFEEPEGKGNREAA